MEYFLRLFGQFFASALPALHVVLILCAVFILAGCSNSSDKHITDIAPLAGLENLASLSVPAQSPGID